MFDSTQPTQPTQSKNGHYSLSFNADTSRSTPPPPETHDSIVDHLSEASSYRSKVLWISRDKSILWALGLVSGCCGIAMLMALLQGADIAGGIYGGLLTVSGGILCWKCYKYYQNINLSNRGEKINLFSENGSKKPVLLGTDKSVVSSAPVANHPIAPIVQTQIWNQFPVGLIQGASRKDSDDTNVQSSQACVQKRVQQKDANLLEQKKVKVLKNWIALHSLNLPSFPFPKNIQLQIFLRNLIFKTIIYNQLDYQESVYMENEGPYQACQQEVYSMANHSQPAVAPKNLYYLEKGEHPKNNFPQYDFLTDHEKTQLLDIIAYHIIEYSEGVHVDKRYAHFISNWNARISSSDSGDVCLEGEPLSQHQDSKLASQELGEKIQKIIYEVLKTIDADVTEVELREDLMHKWSCQQKSECLFQHPDAQGSVENFLEQDSFHHQESHFYMFESTMSFEQYDSCFKELQQNFSVWNQYEDIAKLNFIDCLHNMLSSHYLIYLANRSQYNDILDIFSLCNKLMQAEKSSANCDIKQLCKTMMDQFFYSLHDSFPEKQVGTEWSYNIFDRLMEDKMWNQEQKTAWMQQFFKIAEGMLHQKQHSLNLYQYMQSLIEHGFHPLLRAQCIDLLDQMIQKQASHPHASKTSEQSDQEKIFESMYVNFAGRKKHSSYRMLANHVAAWFQNDGSQQKHVCFSDTEIANLFKKAQQVLLKINTQEEMDIVFSSHLIEYLQAEIQRGMLNELLRMEPEGLVELINFCAALDDRWKALYTQDSIASETYQQRHQALWKSLLTGFHVQLKVQGQVVAEENLWKRIHDHGGKAANGYPIDIQLMIQKFPQDYQEQVRKQLQEQ